MFRKLVSNLNFSPALVGQLGFYAKRLRKEESTRRIGLIFTALALVVQSFAVFSPPESANAASSQDLVYGGVTSVEDFLGYYDRNENNVRDIYTAAGVTRGEIAAAQYSTFNSKDVAYSVGHNARFSAAQGEVAFNYAREQGGNGTVYISPNRLWDTLPYTIENGSTYYAWIGHSDKLGWFAIMKNCGNLAMQVIPPPPPPPVCPAGTIGTPPNCTVPPAPAAACTGLTIRSITRTKVNLTATANVVNGATISAYTYTITDSKGKQILQKSSANATGSDTITADIAAVGTYKATVSVTTSVGEKIDASCNKTIIIPAPDKCPLNPDLTVEDKNCLPCPGNPTIWVKDAECAAQIIESKVAKNLTKDGVDATTILGEASNRIAYTITTKNVGLLPTSTPIKEELSDTLEYSRIIDNGGGTYDEKTQTLTWESVTLKPGQSETRTFVVQLASTIASTARGGSNLSSYDCIMNNTFGNAVSISVDCPAPKVIENVVAELPHTGATENMLFAGIVLSLVTYFYARTRQVKTEVRLIRRDLNAGAF